MKTFKPAEAEDSIQGVPSPQDHCGALEVSFIRLILTIRKRVELKWTAWPCGSEEVGNIVLWYETNVLTAFGSLSYVDFRYNNLFHPDRHLHEFALVHFRSTLLYHHCLKNLYSTSSFCSLIPHSE